MELRKYFPEDNHTLSQTKDKLDLLLELVFSDNPSLPLYEVTKKENLVTIKKKKKTPRTIRAATKLRVPNYSWLTPPLRPTQIHPARGYTLGTTTTSLAHFWRATMLNILMHCILNGEKCVSQQVWETKLSNSDHKIRFRNYHILFDHLAQEWNIRHVS